MGFRNCIIPGNSGTVRHNRFYTWVYYTTAVCRYIHFRYWVIAVSPSCRSSLAVFEAKPNSCKLNITVFYFLEIVKILIN